jgi:NADH-quinone oxidoreductase subunit D
MGMRNPSFATLRALETMCKGIMIADVVALVGSIESVLARFTR